METKTLTPKQLWKGFDNYCSPLDVSVIGYTIVDGIAITEYFFTAFGAEDGDVRVYAKTYAMPLARNTPVILFIDELESDDTMVQAKFYLSLGYTFVTFDFKGKCPDKNLYTRYPESLFYGNINRSGDHLNTATHGVDNTSIFLWAKVARRVISFIEDLPTCDSSNIVSFALNSGANILFQVAATDDRLRSIVPLYNTGFSELSGNISDTSLLDTAQADERNRWIIGLAIPSYAKFVSCPVLYVGTSNSTRFDYLTLGGTTTALPADTYVAELVTFGTDKNVDYRLHKSVSTLLDNIIHDRDNFVPPSISFFATADNYMFDITADNKSGNISKVELHLSYGDCPSAVRNWKTEIVAIDEDGACQIPVKVYDLKVRVYASVSVYYDDELFLSSPLTSFIPFSLAEDIKTKIHNTRIIYDKALGSSAFFVRTSDLIIDNEQIVLKTGPLDILGITTDYDELVSYNIGDISNKGADNTLQFDVFSDKQLDFAVKVTDVNLVEYLTTISLIGDDEWIKITLDISNFKSIEQKPLLSWEHVKALSFVGTKDILFNNIIWI